jgi:hypothetical protein
MINRSRLIPGNPFSEPRDTDHGTQILGWNECEKGGEPSARGYILWWPAKQIEIPVRN